MTAVRRYRTWHAGFGVRAGDIVISAPAKCGATWLQKICALLIFDAAPAAQTHRRFIKTHTPLDGLPFDPCVTYICVGRDPRDAAIAHLCDILLPARGAAPPPMDPVERFWHWVEDDAPPDEGLELLLHHLRTFWDRRHAPNVVLVHDADLRTDLEGEMRRLAGRLGIAIDSDRWPGLVAQARSDGTGGLLPALLGDEDLERYWARVHRLAPSDLSAWTHYAVGGR